MFEKTDTGQKFENENIVLCENSVCLLLSLSPCTFGEIK